MNKFPLIVAGCVMLALASPGSGADNAVLYWNEQALNATRLSRTPPPLAAIRLASVHAAIFDVVSSVTHTHAPWLSREPAPEGIDLDAAIAGAAYTALKGAWAEAVNARNFETALTQALATIPDGPAETEGVAWGRKVAELVLAKRAQAGLDRPLAESFSSEKMGEWRETPPQFRPALLPHVKNVTPFVMKSPDQFRAPPPPALDSKQCADELAEIARIGARDGSDRTEYQTLAAPFWSDDLGTATPPGHWNVIAQDLARRQGLSTPESARLFALLNFACADAGICVWDTKFHYRTWRPETALRDEAYKAINPHVVSHPEFIPLMQSPPFPSYISGHSGFSAAASRLLERYFGTDDIEFTTTSDGLPGAVRTFKKLSEARDEIGMSRLWGGIHVMADNVQGQACGVKIADWVFDNALQPVKP
ncbi:MAG: vanadium-dependent haloperoxidase [Opitutaceae bacterium]|nr:vanadium-dependent haloperoxidase [Opitutaceae bacterium]